MGNMHFHIAHINIILMTTLFRIQGIPMNNLTPMKIVLLWGGGGGGGVQGNLN